MRKVSSQDLRRWQVLKRMAVEVQNPDPEIGETWWHRNVAFFANSVRRDGQYSDGQRAVYDFFQHIAEVAGIDSKPDMGKQPWWGRMIMYAKSFLSQIISQSGKARDQKTVDEVYRGANSAFRDWGVTA